MNGYQLYQQYTQAGQLAERDSDAWCYGHLLHRAFYVVGITRLFDLLEQAQLTNQRVGLVYTSLSTASPLVPNDIELVDHPSPAILTASSVSTPSISATRPYSWLFSDTQVTNYIEST